MHTYIYILIFLFCGLFVQAQIPPGYYDNAEGREGPGLRQALHEIIRDHNAVSYNSLWEHFEYTDKKSDQTVWDMYSDIPGETPAYIYNFGIDQCGQYSQEGDCYNREHSWPESWYNDLGLPMKTDLFHVYPTDGFVNAKRANYPFGEVGEVTWESTNGGKLGISNYPGWSGFIVFEPIDEYKGDFARTYFYMATRYYAQDAGWDSNEMVDGANIKEKPLQMLLEWHEQDPVSQKEINRNNWVYNIQGNRNPFIDNPIFANAIWDPEYCSIEEGKYSNLVEIFPNPASNFVNISAGLNYYIESIKVIDVQGREVFFKEKTFPVLYNMCVDNFTNGIYILQISLSNQQTETQRMVILNE